MSSATLLLQLAGAVTLLVWAVRQVRTGVERAFGPALKRLIRRAADSRLSMAAVGAAVAMTLQSSTAVAILVSGFTAGGLIAGAAALALLLGADLGSALVVSVFSLDLSWLMPLLLVLGGALFLKGEARRVKQAGRILMGIALILVSLQMMSDATAPLRDSEALPAVVAFLADEPLIVFLVSALFTWMIHSSVASILLYAALAVQGIVPASAAVPLVLGANLGGGLIAMGLTRGASPEAGRLPLGNLIFRAGGALAALAALSALPLPADRFGLEPGLWVVALHVGFNAALVLAGLPLTAPVAALTERMLPLGDTKDPQHPLERRESALDRSVMATPRLALASAARELLHIGEVVEVMFAPVMTFFDGVDSVLMERLRRLDDRIDASHADVKLYLAELNRGRLSEEEARRSMDLAGYAINLEHIGDLISKDLYGLAEKRHKQSVDFSPEGRDELVTMHDRVHTNLRLAMNVLVSGDVDSARELVTEKERMREMERASHSAHLRRLQTGQQDSVDTSSLHLETIRALKQINSLTALFAYPILTDRGELLDSRLTRSA